MRLTKIAQTGRPVSEWNAAGRLGSVSMSGCREKSPTASFAAREWLIATATSDDVAEMLCLRARLPKVGNFAFVTAFKQK